MGVMGIGGVCLIWGLWGYEGYGDMGVNVRVYMGDMGGMGIWGYVWYGGVRGMGVSGYRDMGGMGDMRGMRVHLGCLQLHPSEQTHAQHAHAAFAACFAHHLSWVWVSQGAGVGERYG